MESVKTNTEVKFTQNDTGTVAIKKGQVIIGFVIMILVFAINVGTATFYVTSVKSEQSLMRKDIDELKTKDAESKRDDEEILRLLQEISFNLQETMERQKMIYKTLPKGK